jgi:hypothetical protein
VGQISTEFNKKKAPVSCETGAFIGAGEMNRTPDLLITNELLYRLSYTGVLWNTARDYSPEW